MEYSITQLHVSWTEFRRAVYVLEGHSWAELGKSAQAAAKKNDVSPLGSTMVSLVNMTRTSWSSLARLVAYSTIFSAPKYHSGAQCLAFRSLVFSVWCLGFRSLVFSVQCLGFLSLVFSVWCLGFRSLVFSVQCLGFRSLVFSVWCLAFGVWYSVFGVLAFGVWYLVFGVLRLWYSMFGVSAFRVCYSAISVLAWGVWYSVTVSWLLESGVQCFWVLTFRVWYSVFGVSAFGVSGQCFAFRSLV
jgi:hypothetical protein